MKYFNSEMQNTSKNICNLSFLLETVRSLSQRARSEKEKKSIKPFVTPEWTIMSMVWIYNLGTDPLYHPFCAQ